MDQSNISPINGKALAKLPSASPQNLQAKTALRPAAITEVVATLARNLALVRPVGMAQKDADEWLRVAAAELKHLPSDILAKGCATARTTCTHHGQIIPAVLKDVAEWIDARKSLAAPAVRPDRTLAKPDQWVPAPGELEEIKRQAADSLRVNQSGSR